MAKRILKLALPLIILALSIVGAGYLRATKPDLTPKAPVEKVWPVSAVEVAPSDIQPTLRVFGEIVAGREVEMRPLVAGRVVEAGPDFVEGGVLRRGDLMVAIDPFDYSARVTDRTAALAEARAKLREIEAELRPTGRSWCATANRWRFAAATSSGAKASSVVVLPRKRRWTTRA